MAAIRLFLAVALVVYHCHGTLSGQLYRRLPNYRLEQANVLRETAIGNMMNCASLCHANHCNAYIMNKSVTTQPRCMVVTYSLAHYLISDHNYDLYIMADAPLPLKTNLDGYYGGWQSPLYCPVGYYVYGYRLWLDPFNGNLFGEDDCGVTGVKLLCINRQGDTKSVEYQLDYPTTDRGMAICPGNEPVDSFMIKLGPNVGAEFDDEGMSNLKLICQTSRSSLQVYTGSYQGTWSEETQCPTGLVVCGMRLRAVIPDVYDDTCINDMVVMCCLV